MIITFLCLFSGHAQIVHLLLERNKSGTIPSDSQGATPLHYAAQSNFAVSKTRQCSFFLSENFYFYIITDSYVVVGNNTTRFHVPFT